MHCKKANFKRTAKKPNLDNGLVSLVPVSEKCTAEKTTYNALQENQLYTKGRCTDDTLITPHTSPMGSCHANYTTSTVVYAIVSNSQFIGGYRPA